MTPATRRRMNAPIELTVATLRPSKTTKEIATMVHAVMARKCMTIG
jgi:hypothetical protein